MSLVDLAVFLSGDLFNTGSNPGAGFFDHFQAFARFGDMTLGHLNNRQGIANMVVEIPYLSETTAKASISSSERYPDEDAEERSFNPILDKPLVNPCRMKLRRRVVEQQAEKAD